MAQKAHPNILRPQKELHPGSTHWNEPKFYYTTSTIHRLIESCCSGTNQYPDNVTVKRHAGLIFIEVRLIHLHFGSKRRLKSRRHKENKDNMQKRSWNIVLCRLYTALELIQKFTGTKKITLKIEKLKTYTRAIPRPARRQVAYYTKSFHRTKYSYARYGMQLMSLIVQGKASAFSLSRFLRQNICSRQRRKRHHHFLAFIKQGFQALEKYRRVQGLKIQIKGRFTHKAKGRSRVWKYQMGRMPLSQLDKNIQAEYTQTQTAYGSVGLKVWLCNY